MITATEIHRLQDPTWRLSTSSPTMLRRWQARIWPELSVLRQPDLARPTTAVADMLAV